MTGLEPAYSFECQFCIGNPQLNGSPILKSQWGRNRQWYTPTRTKFLSGSPMISTSKVTTRELRLVLFQLSYHSREGVRGNRTTDHQVWIGNPNLRLVGPMKLRTRSEDRREVYNLAKVWFAITNPRRLAILYSVVSPPGEELYPSLHRMD